MFNVYKQKAYYYFLISYIL